MSALFAWLRNEWRLAMPPTWSSEPQADYFPCSHNDPKCKALAEKQAEARRKLKRTKRGLLDDKPYTKEAATDIRVTLDAARRVNTPAVRKVK